MFAHLDHGEYSLQVAEVRRVPGCQREPVPRALRTDVHDEQQVAAMANPAWIPTGRGSDRWTEPSPSRRLDCDHEVTTMAKLRNVGVREFRDHATNYLSGSDPIAVSKHGRVIGFYIPLQRDEDEVRRAVAKLGDTVGQVLEESGLSEDELAALLDLRRQHAR